MYFIRRTTQPGHYRFFLIPPKNPYSNQATQKNTFQIFVPKKIPESKISNPKKSFDHPRHLKSPVPPPPPPGQKPHLPVAHAYADDSQLYVSFKPNNEVNESIAIVLMELFIRGIRTRVWMDKLTLNDDKTELMIIGSRQQLEKVSVAELSVGNTSVASASTTGLLV